MADDNLVNFKVGKVICGRWRVTDRLGTGGCGAVFRVEDTTRSGFFAALKAEAINANDGGTLKMEVEVLHRMESREHVIRQFDAGRRKDYTFVVMTLGGSDLMRLKCTSRSPWSEHTIYRVAILALFAIKQIHDVGFVHRDIKPGNLVTGFSGRDKRMLFLIDFGMIRAYVNKTANGQYKMRKPRKEVLLRGTPRYCSLNVHKRIEQGRVDDLWSLLYLLVELYSGLPWTKLKNEKEIRTMKEKTTDDELFRLCPTGFKEISAYLKTVDTPQEPDYVKVFTILKKGLDSNKGSFMDKFEWESAFPSEETAIEPSPEELKTLKKDNDCVVQLRLFPQLNIESYRPTVLNF